ncbi:MAG: hypothetical protein CVV51_03915 [Spirochaetae bacterium HGW-Spirochaetae-7]|jgi:hypothetical protein|nr:MAG: hypothetical protein CVV51_03915 [Spirochaetae bacterium HGW-Spirochaetae-7]
MDVENFRARSFGKILYLIDSAVGAQVYMGDPEPRYRLQRTASTLRSSAASMVGNNAMRRISDKRKSSRNSGIRSFLVLVSPGRIVMAHDGRESVSGQGDQQYIHTNPVGAFRSKAV